MFGNFTCVQNSQHLTDFEISHDVVAARAVVSTAFTFQIAYNVPK